LNNANNIISKQKEYLSLIMEIERPLKNLIEENTLNAYTKLEQ